MNKIKIVLTIIMLIIICFTLTGCENKEIPFGKQYNMELSSKDEEFEIPVYFFAEDENGRETTIEGLEFLKDSMTYKLIDWNISKPDENGNVTISYTCRATGEIDFKVPETNTKRWFYTFSISSPFAFDYYTGEIYRENRINVNNDKTKIMENGIEEKNDDDVAYTEINFNKNTTKVGINTKINFKGYEQVKYIGLEDGYYHYKGPIESEYTTYITVPEDYDGVLIAIRKKGTTKEDNEKEEKKYYELVEMQKQAKETGKKSEELINLEKEKDEVFRLVDPNNEKRKDVKIDDYYFIKTADVFNIQSKNQETNYMFIIILLVVIAIIVAGIAIIIMKKKGKKENRRTKRPLAK